MLPGRPYLMKIGTRTVTATVAHPKYKVNVNTLEHTAAKTLELNEIGVCNISLDRPVPFDPYVENRDMGGFILIDRFTNATVAAGMLHFALRRADNVHWQAVEVDKTARATPQGPAPCRGLVHRAVRRRQVDDREPRRTAARVHSATTPTSSTATTSATASTGTSASPRPTGSRTSAGSPRSRRSWPTPD